MIEINDLIRYVGLCSLASIGLTGIYYVLIYLIDNDKDY